MINLLAEGRAYHEILDFVERFENMQYEFYKHDNLDKGMLAAYRYPQPKLFSKEHKFSLYPTQLVVLARYYFYHHEKEKLSIEELEKLGKEDAIRGEEAVRSLLCKWLTTLREKLQNNKEEYAAWATFDQFLSPWFQMPLHSNMLPLDVIVQEAKRAGRLDREEFMDYPDPTGLPVLKKNGENEDEWVVEEYKFESTVTTDEEKKTAKKAFWEAQLEALVRVRHPASKEETIVKYSTSREIYAMLMLSVWYAQQFQLHRKKMEALGLKMEEAFCAPAEVDRISRTHMEFYGSLDKKLLIYRTMFKRLPVTFGNESNSMLQVTYADPKKEKQTVTLPAWNDLDNGCRNWDYGDYYGIKVDFLTDVLKMFSFEEKQPKYTFEEYVPKLKKIEKTLKAFYLDVAEMLYCIWNRAVKADEDVRKKMEKKDHVPEKGTELMQKAMQTGDLTSKERTYLQNYLKVYFGIKIEEEAENNKKINATAGKHIAKMTNSGVIGDTLRKSITYLSGYMITQYWDSMDSRNKYEKVRDGLSRNIKNEFIVAQEPHKALAEIIARTYTWAVLLRNDWEKSGAQKGDTIFWNRPRHLNISADQLTAEAEFKKKLLTSLEEKMEKPEKSAGQSLLMEII